jgi:hypothetical protein
MLIESFFFILQLIAEHFFKSIVLNEKGFQSISIGCGQLDRILFLMFSTNLII